MEACNKAFCTLKENLASIPVLAYPTLNDMFILDMNASSVAIVAVHSQVQNGTEKVIAYFSRDRIEAKHMPENDSFCGAVTRNGSRAVI